MATPDEWMQSKTGDHRHVERAKLTRIFKPQPWIVACPICRGYSLEKRWCHKCGGAGVVETSSH